MPPYYGPPPPYGQPAQHPRSPSSTPYEPQTQQPPAHPPPGQPSPVGSAGTQAPQAPQADPSAQPAEQYGPAERAGQPRPDPVDAGGHLSPDSHEYPGYVRVPLAGFRARAVSFVIDHLGPWVVLGTVLLLAGIVNGAQVAVLGTVGAVAVVAFSIWNSGYRQGTTGQSVGRRVARTRLVSIRTGAPVGFATALLRHLCHLLEFGVGYLWPLWDKRQQTFADKIVGTVVVRSES